MDQGIAFLLCVPYLALSQVPITNAEWKGNVCRTKIVEYFQEMDCKQQVFSQCVVYKTKLKSKNLFYEACCPEWQHNGDQNCNIHGPDNITFIPDKANINEVGSLNITCLANCYSSCSFQWIKQGNSDTEERLVGDMVTMQIRNATRRDAGNYSCRAMNRVTNKTVVDTITLEVLYNDDLGLSNSTDITETTHPLSDALRIPNLIITALASTALVLACLICGFLIYETRKRFYKPIRHFSTAAEVGPANNMEFNTNTDPDTNIWTIGNDSNRGLYTSVDNTDALVYDQPLAIKQNLV